MEAVTALTSHLWKSLAWNDVIPNRAKGPVRNLFFRERDRMDLMLSYPIKTCVVCGEEFELKPGKLGFANRCPSCSEEDADPGSKSADPLKTDKGANAARREAMKNLLYRKDN
jgi:hypothetical protein